MSHKEKRLEACVRFLGDTYAIKDGQIRRIVDGEYFHRVDGAQLVYDLLMRAHDLRMSPHLGSSIQGKWWSVKFDKYPWVQERDLLTALMEAVSLWDYEGAGYL